ncbi:MAG: translation elongation factor Ts [Rhodospirillales bacterium]|nr:translation elongation factor Ts [Rhodospirillales bacterium]
MAQITAALVKELREKTGAGMMDCKKALGENDGDVEASIDWLRTKGLATAAKKAGRVASEGLVGIAIDGTKGAVVEINAETDFVARNETFQDFVTTAANIALTTGNDVDALRAAPFPGEERTVQEQLTHMIATIGENMSIRRVQTLSVDKGVISSYIHTALAPGIGKIGVLVALETEADAAKADAFGKQLAMHVAAAKPQSISRDDMDQEVVDRERAIFAEQARESGKPAEIVEKMVEGRIRKFYEEACLVDQTFVIDGDSKVSKAIEAAGKDAGGSMTLKGFSLFVLGDGIEKEEEDFAAEVAAVAGN